MIWGRSELEALGRDELLSRARRVAIPRPELMTRMELIEELVRIGALDDGDRRLAKSLLGKARDLVARVMDLGLHLPDAAQRLRASPQAADDAAAPAPLATMALAEVYATQGHRSQALAVLDQVLARDPNHVQALRLRAKLIDEPSAPATAEAPPAADATPAPASQAQPPRSSSELRAEARGEMLVLSWRIRPLTYASRLALLRGGRLVLRVVRVEPSLPEPHIETVDREIDSFSGSIEVASNARLDSICAVVGLRTEDRLEVIAALG